MPRVHQIGLCALVAITFTAGCNPSIPARPPRPVNPLYQNGPAKEGTLEFSIESVRQGLSPLIEKAGWKTVANDASPTDGRIEAEAKKGERVEIQYESRGEKQTAVTIKGTSTTPKAAVDGLGDKILKGSF